MENKANSTEADAFRAFAKKVVSVPKAVIDKRENEYLKRRETVRKARAA